MPRLRQVTRAEATAPSVLAAYDRLFGPDRDPVADPGTASGSRGDWWTVFALSPDVLQHAVAGFGLYRDSDITLDPILRELAQARAGWFVGSQFVYSQHCKSLRSLGVDDAKIAGLAGWQACDGFSAVERSVLAYTDALVGDRGRVSDQTFGALTATLTDSQVLELTYITSMYIMHATICRALRLEFDDVDERVEEVAAPVGARNRDIGADIAGR